MLNTFLTIWAIFGPSIGILVGLLLALDRHPSQRGR